MKKFFLRLPKLYAKAVLSALCIIAFLSSTKSDETNLRGSLLTTFPSVTIGKQTWMTNNWDYHTPKCWYYDNDSIGNKNLGRLYFFSNAMAAAPPGWHLPTLEEWLQLIKELGGINQAKAKMIEGGSSGLNLQFGGNKSANISPTDIFNFKNETAFYWSATPEGEQTAYAIRLDTFATEVDIHSYRRANGFAVRYLKNQ